MVFLDYYESPMGKITLAAEGQYLIGLWFDGQKYDRLALKGRECMDMKEAIKGKECTDMKEDLKGKECTNITEALKGKECTNITEALKPDLADVSGISCASDTLGESVKSGVSGASDASEENVKSDISGTSYVSEENVKSDISGTSDVSEENVKSDISGTSDISEEAVACSRVLGITRQWLDLYFYGRDPGFNLPLHVEGSELRQTVAKVMLSIPFGTTMTYGEIAKKASEILGWKKVSPRSVGGAVGHNSISVIIPCHRVVGSDGSLTGYAGGLNKKSALLELEKNTVHLKFLKS